MSERIFLFSELLLANVTGRRVYTSGRFREVLPFVGMLRIAVMVIRGSAAVDFGVNLARAACVSWSVNLVVVDARNCEIFKGTWKK